MNGTLCETCQWAFRDSWVWNSSLQSGQINGASKGNLGSLGGINAWVATSNFGKNCECTLLTCPLKHGRGFLLVISTLITGRHSKHEYFMPTLPFSFNNDSSYLKNSLTWISYFWASSCPSMIFSGSLCTWFWKSLWKKELKLVENNCFPGPKTHGSYTKNAKIESRDMNIECSKQFKWNLYFYVSGQSGPFWAVLKVLENSNIKFR